MFDNFLKIAGIAFLCCAEFSVHAQRVSFLPHQDIPLGFGCCQVVAGDFNGDGKMDLVVNYGPTIDKFKLYLLRGDGNGGFLPPVALNPPGGLFRVIAADVNRDGKLDLVADSYAQTVVYLGKGDGTFEPPFAVGVAPSALLAVADFNGDGIPDLLSSFGPSQVGIQLGKGDGTFRPPLSITGKIIEDGIGDGFSYDIVVADLNGDGKLDVVWTSDRTGANSVWVALGNGDGTLQPFSPNFQTFGGVAGGKPIAIADLNHDGKLDLIASGRDNNVNVWLNKGAGTFQQRVNSYVYQGPSASSVATWRDGNDIFVADFNGDGNPDIMVDNALLLGNGDGTFQAPLFFATGVPNATLVFVGDLNGDGKPDLVFINGGGSCPECRADTLSVLLNNSPGFSNSVQGYSAASGASLLAPGSIGSIYGKNLPSGTQSAAAGTALPTELGGISLRVRDSTDGVRLAPLYYVSPDQINFVVPANTEPGPVTLTIDPVGVRPLKESANATIVNDVSPGFFTSNGIPGASAVRVLSNGAVEPVAVFNCANASQCALTPIDLGKGAVYLSLYGTGFRATKTAEVGHPPNAKCQAGGVDAPVQFVGAQPTFTGLDQINILLPPSLPHGKATIQCGFLGGTANHYFNPSDDGLWHANPVQIAIQ
jgi:uncharacterized protein (TIGR03437 family)